MPDTANTDDTGRELSLLALGEALREQPPAPSRLAKAIAEVRAEQSASVRHRLARSRREAHEGPLLSALRLADDGKLQAVEPTPDAATITSVAEAPPEPKAAPAAAKVRRSEPARAESAAPSQTAASLPAEPEATIAAPADPPKGAVAERKSLSELAARLAEEQRELGGHTARPDERPQPVDDHWKPMINPARVLSGVMRSGWLILATTIAGALIGVAIAVTTPKTYEASVELLADPRDLNLVDRELTQSGLSNEATLAIVENQVRILTSGRVLNQVVEKLGLENDPEFNGQAKPGGISGFTARLRALVSPGSGADDPGRRYTLAIEHLAENLTVERSGKTFVIVISARSHEPEKSALIANTMTDVFLEAYGKLQSDAAGRAADELTSKLDELRANVEAAERKVESFKAEHEIIDPQGRLLTDDEIAKLNDQLTTARARTLELNTRAASMRSVDLDALLGGDLPESLTSPTIQELRAQHAALKSEADRLAVRLGPRHPQRMQIDAQLAGARERIGVELRRIVASAQTELKRAVQLEQELSSRMAQLKVRQGSVSEDLVELRELERDSAAKRAVYEAYLKRARETGEQQGINSANMSVISKASAPLTANPPSRSTIAMTGTMLGFLAGLGLGILRGTVDSLRDTVAGTPRRRWRPRLLDSVSLGRRKRASASNDPAMPGVTDVPPAAPTNTVNAYAGKVPVQDAPPAADAAQSRETPMPNPAYAAYPPFPPQQPAAQYPQAPAYAAPYYPPQASQQPPAYPQYAYPEAYPQQPAPNAYAPPYYAQPPHPGQQMGLQPHQPHWQQPPMNVYPYPQAMQPGPYAPQPMHPQPAAYAQPPVAEARRMPTPVEEAPQTPIEEIRASLREFRDAIKELSQQRSRRRYF